MDLSFISDMHKDAYGFRPSSGEYDRIKAMTPKELADYYKRLEAAVERSIDEERAREAQAILNFEARIERQMREVGAPDRATFVRWDMDALDVVIDDGTTRWYDEDFYKYKLGLPYSYDVWTAPVRS